MANWKTSICAAAVSAVFVLSPVRASCSEMLSGINYSGSEYGGRTGKKDVDYTLPSPSQLKYFSQKGFEVIRFPFKWERLQPELGSDLSESHLAEIREVVTASSANGADLILDPHNYARYDKKLIGSPDVTSSHFADFWGRLARAFANDPRVIFGLMNEPHGLPATQWRDIAQEAILAIRATGANNLILVPGVAWTGAHSWARSGNAAALGDLKDPANNMVFEVHQYLDSDFSGTKPSCPNPRAGQDALRAVGDWLEEGGRRGFLGEFGASADTACLEGLNLMLSEIQRRPNLWVGWTYWAAGHWWPKDYPMSIQPLNGEDRPQMDVLLRHLD